MTGYEALWYEEARKDLSSLGFDFSVEMGHFVVKKGDKQLVFCGELSYLLGFIAGVKADVCRDVEKP